MFRQGSVRRRTRRLVLAVSTSAALVAALAAPSASALEATIREFTVPTARSQPVGITKGPDGAIWFTEAATGKIGRFERGTITEFPLSESSVKPERITSGPDGALWFTEWSGNAIGRITTEGSVTTYPIAEPSESPAFITPAAGALFFDTLNGGEPRLHKITTEGEITNYALPESLPGGAWGLTADASGNVVFASPVGGGVPGDAIGSLEPTSGTISAFPLTGAEKFPLELTLGPDRAVWFTENRGQAIGRLSEGTITEFPTPSGALPVGIATGGDGALWFTEPGRDKIGRMTTSGEVEELEVPTAAAIPEDIVRTSRTVLWFTEVTGNKIARITIR